MKPARVGTDLLVVGPGTGPHTSRPETLGDVVVKLEGGASGGALAVMESWSDAGNVVAEAPGDLRREI